MARKSPFAVSFVVAVTGHRDILPQDCDIVAEDLKAFQQTGMAGIRPAQDAIRELGRLALEENGDWLAMHRERKLPILKT